MPKPKRTSAKERRDGRPGVIGDSVVVTFRPREKCPWHNCARWNRCVAGDGEMFVPSLSYSGPQPRVRSVNQAFRLIFKCAGYVGKRG